MELKYSPPDVDGTGTTSLACSCPLLLHQSIVSSPLELDPASIETLSSTQASLLSSLLSQVSERPLRALPAHQLVSVNSPPTHTWTLVEEDGKVVLRPQDRLLLDSGGLTTDCFGLFLAAIQKRWFCLTDFFR